MARAAGDRRQSASIAGQGGVSTWLDNWLFCVHRRLTPKRRRPDAGFPRRQKMSTPETMTLREKIRRIGKECDRLYMTTLWYPFLLVFALVVAILGFSRSIELISR
jgi:hypothetical protein